MTDSHIFPVRSDNKCFVFILRSVVESRFPLSQSMDNWRTHKVGV